MLRSHHPDHRSVALLYFGPEVLMPVLSAVAAAVGAILIVGKRALHWIRSAGRWVAGLFGASEGEAGEEGTGDAGPRSSSAGTRRDAP